MVSQSYMDTISTISFWTLTIRRFTGWWVTISSQCRFLHGVWTIWFSQFVLLYKKWVFNNGWKRQVWMKQFCCMDKCLNTIFVLPPQQFPRRKTIVVTILFSSTRRNHNGQHRGPRLSEPGMLAKWLNNQPLEQQIQSIQCQWGRAESKDPLANKLHTIVGKRGQNVLVHSTHNWGVQWYGTRWSATMLWWRPTPTIRLASAGLFAQRGGGLVFLRLSHEWETLGLLNGNQCGRI